MSVAVPVVETWDGLNRRIYLKQGVTAYNWIDDIYKEYRYQRRINESFRKWKALLMASGNNLKGGGKYTPRFITLLEGTKIIPYDENISIRVSGEAITDNADVDPELFDTSGRTQPLKLYIEPSEAEIIIISGGSALTTAQDERLTELHRLGGLDASNPLIVSETQRSAGNITQTISEVSGTVTVTRQ